MRMKGMWNKQLTELEIRLKEQKEESRHDKYKMKENERQVLFQDE